MLWITGRAKDLIIRGGHNIDPAEIEEALMAHPDVAFVGAVGQPDAHAGEIPCAYVELVEGGAASEADLMQFAYDKGQPSALASFEATGRAYLAFARKYPGHYIAMFESGISVNRTPELAAVAARARGVMEQAATDLSQHIPPEKRPPASMFSAHIWAMSHGVVELFARNSPGTQSPFPPEDLLETGIGVYLRGLGLIKPDA